MNSRTQPLHAAQVYFKMAMRPPTFRGELEALRVLEMEDCCGPLCIDCRLPALQASDASLHISLQMTFAWSLLALCCEDADMAGLLLLS